MAQAIPVTAQLDASELSIAGVSWAAVLADAAASLSITLVLISFGVGMGFAVVSPWGNSGVSATTFKIGTVLFFIVMAMLSSSIGGYLAGEQVIMHHEVDYSLIVRESTAPPRPQTARGKKR